METAKLVQINFDYQPPDAIAAQQAAWERAHEIAQVPGLIWKIWIHNAATLEAGGIYLLQDAASAQAYESNPLERRNGNGTAFGSMAWSNL
jgi:hypothetical protein